MPKGRARRLMSQMEMAVFMAAVVAFIGFMSFSAMPPTTFEGPPSTSVVAHKTTSHAQAGRSGQPSSSTRPSDPPWWEG